jgi:hypothetical protein
MEIKIYLKTCLKTVSMLSKGLENGDRRRIKTIRKIDESIKTPEGPIASLF